MTGCLSVFAFQEKATLPDHALYLSMTEITFTASGAGIVRIKVFSDDLQNALKNFSDTYKPEDLYHFFGKNQSLATEYFKAHFQLSINGGKVNYQLSDFQIENDAHFITFQFIPPSAVQSIRLEADFFMELFPTQTNVVKVSKAGKPYYFKFTSPTQPETLTWTR